MFNKKTSCLIRGIIGILFGALALMLPDLTLGTFYGFFWVLLILGIGVFGFLAITGKGDESILWFVLAAGLLLAGVLSILFAWFVAFLFILIIAAVAAYNGFSDITLALTSPKTKYVFIPAMILTGFAFLALLFYYFPGFEKNFWLSVVGTFALAFGIFSVLLGFTRTVESTDDDTTPPQMTAYARHKQGGKK